MRLPAVATLPVLIVGIPGSGAEGGGGPLPPEGGGAVAPAGVGDVAGHDRRYPELRREERGRAAAADGGEDDRVVAPEVLPRPNRGPHDGRIDGRLGRLDAVQVHHLDVPEAAPVEVLAQELQDRARALAHDEPEIHLHERLRGDYGLRAGSGVAGLDAGYVRRRAEE